MTQPKVAYVIDDDDEPKVTNTKFLEEAGYQVIGFQSVDAALEYMEYDEKKGVITNNIPTVVVTDNNTCCKHEGWELAQILEKTSTACVMVASLPHNCELAEQYGAIGLVKPVKEPEILLSAVKRAVEKAALQKIGIAENSHGRGVSDD